MIRNYLTVAFRSLLRNRFASALKIISLAVGLICFAVIALYVHHELNFDTFHENPEQVFRVVKDFVNDDGSKIPDATTPPAFGPALQRDLPEVAYSTRIFPNWGRKYLLQVNEVKSYEEGVLRIDSSFFDVFSFPFVKGDKKTALENSNFIILTESAAKRFFGDVDPIGKPIKLDLSPTGIDFFVTGVVKDVPQQSHFTFDFLISIRSFLNPYQLDTDWGFYNFYTYVRLKPEANPEIFQSKIQGVFKKYQPENDNICYAQPLTDIHLKSNLKWELSTNGDYSYIKILGTIALFAIMLAAINYINLVTAQSAKRAKEVGIRKVSGALRQTLVGQFLLESMLMAGVATFLSIVVAESILPVMSSLFNSTLILSENMVVLSLVIVVGLSTGLVAGLYPALYLSSFLPVSVLKGSVAGYGGDVFLRKGLVTFQFIISTVLIVGTFVISSQIDFVRNKKLGFSKDNVMIINNARGLQNRDALLTEIRKVNGVIHAGAADGIIGGQNWTTSVRAKDHENSLLLNFLSTDYDFLDVMNVAFAEGRNFSRNTQADSAAVILNLTAVAQLGMKLETAIGSQVNAGSNENPEYYTVIGVIDDFHFTSFHNPIKPFGFFLIEPRVNRLFVKVNGDGLKSTLSEIEKLWTTLVPERPFEFTFQDEQVAKLYANEVKFQKLFTGFTYLAIIIACLGLFGLSAYTAQQRTKEIGIRKVLGASVSDITLNLSNEFLKLVLIAIVISTPIAWYGMTKWLQNFAYRVELNAWMFVSASIATIVIALLTVSFQSIKAGLANPVKSLRSE